MNKIKLGLVVLSLLTASSLTPAIPKTTSPVTIKKSEIECLAKNIYHEARGEPLEGQIAVAQVTVNRVKSGEFQSSICKAVYAEKQFSWTAEKSKKIKDRKAWEDSVIIARAVLTKSIPLPDFRALYFHTIQVRPVWSRTKKIVAKIGNHIFYA